MAQSIPPATPPRSPLILLAALMGGLWLIHLAMIVGVPSPYIFPDELIYLELSRHLAHGDGFLFRGEPMRFPTVLYPLLLVPAQWASDPSWAFRLVQATSSALMVLTVLPIYGLARRLLGVRWAMAAAVLAMVAPYTIYAHTAMAEGLFLCLIMAVAWATMQAVLEPAERWKWLLGLLMGLAFFAKPQGMLLAPVVVGTFLASEAWRREPGFWRRLAAFWPAVGVFAAVVGLHVVRTALTMPGADLTSLATYLGTYSGGLSGTQPFTWAHFGGAVAGIVGALGLSTGFWPLPLFAVFAWRTARQGSLAERAYLAFALLAIAMLIGLAAQNVAILDPRQIQERYTFYVGPLVLIGALSALAQGRVPWRTAGAIALGLIGLATLLIERASHTYVDTPAYMATYRFMLSLGWTGTAVAVGLIGVSYLAATGLAWARGQARLAFALAALYGVLLTGLSFYGQRALSGVYAREKPFVGWVQAHARPDRPIALVSDGLPYIPAMLTDVFSRQPIRQVYLARAFAPWLEQRVTVTTDGQLRELSALIDGTRVLAHRSVALDLPVLGRRDEVVIYEKQGPVRLRGRR